MMQNMATESGLNMRMAENLSLIWKKAKLINFEKNEICLQV